VAVNGIWGAVGKVDKPNIASKRVVMAENFLVSRRRNILINTQLR
jgi:hypothetical protein